MERHPDFPYPLYLVLSEKDCKQHHYLKVLEEAIAGGVDIVQLREKEDSNEVFLHKAIKVKSITDRHGIPLIINDRPDIAAAICAHGVHVGNNDMPPAYIRKSYPELHIGYSIEYLDQLGGNELPLANYIALSPIFRTATKTDTVTEWGLQGIKNIRSATSKALVAIGGINRHNIAGIVQAGAHSVAVVSAICASAAPGKSAAELKSILLS